MEIKSALTREQWKRLAVEYRDASLRAGIALIPHGGPTDPMRQLYLLEKIEGEKFVDEIYLHRHLFPHVAALVMHEQPFGFTWAEHDALCTPTHERTEGEQALAERAIANIAALLKPRD